jgi:hypothetical protein
LDFILIRCISALRHFESANDEYYDIPISLKFQCVSIFIISAEDSDNKEDDVDVAGAEVMHELLYCFIIVVALVVVVVQAAVNHVAS